jgi:citronellol/citronellal dehydrogenase
MGYQSIFRADAFDDKVIIVTGGGSGIGRCTAHELASLGAQVVITGRKIEKLEKLQQKLAKMVEKSILSFVITVMKNKSKA